MVRSRQRAKYVAQTKSPRAAYLHSPNGLKATARKAKAVAKEVQAENEMLMTEAKLQQACKEVLEAALLDLEEKHKHLQASHRQQRLENETLEAVVKQQELAMTTAKRAHHRLTEWPGSRMLASKYHPYKRQGGQAARCLCCVRSTPAGSTGWVEIHVEGEAASYRSGPSARICARAAAAAFAVGQRLRGQEVAPQLQPMPRLCSTPTQAGAQLEPAHAPCSHQFPDQPPSHPSQSQLQGSSQHHPALPALLHLPGLSILTRPATKPVTSPAEAQQPIIHITEEQDEQTMPPSMLKQQQDWATARAIAAAVLQQIQQVPALLRLLRSQPDSKVTLHLSILQDAEAQLGRLEFALQHIMQPR
ncbi:hypothetical protein QJQ45_007735 [Haematococcus lacustris]|nr:hypothetical protein QJQ45_007735 [Haematococcus lacustris]